MTHAIAAAIGALAGIFGLCIVQGGTKYDEEMEEVENDELDLDEI